MTSDDQIRTDLETYFVQPFTDDQWRVIESEGYLDAIATGRRTAEDVARELQGLMALLGEGPSGTESPESKRLQTEPATWEEMERLVLARTLFGPKTPSPAAGPSPGHLGAGSRGRAGRHAHHGRRRRWVWIALIVLAIGVIAAVLSVYVGCGEPTAATMTSLDRMVSGASSTTALPSSTTIGEAPTTMSSTTTSTIATTTAASTITTASTTTITSTTTTAPLPQTFTANLSGAEAVPQVSTSASGTLELTVAVDGSSVDYVLTVRDLANLTVARLRQGGAGQTGDVIFTLHPGPPRTDTLTGVAAQGSITADQLQGPLAGKTITDLVTLLEAGSIYVNVGSTAHTGGEIRGQLR